MNLAGVLAERGDAVGALPWAAEALSMLARTEKGWSAHDALSLIALRLDKLEVAAMLQGLSDAACAAAGLEVREPNESRIHATVAKALAERMNSDALEECKRRGASLDQNEAWRILIG